VSEDSELDQRIIVFTRAFQDIIQIIMKEKLEKEQLKKEIQDIKRELKKLRK